MAIIDSTLLHVLDREVQAAIERRLLSLGEPQLVHEGGESLLGLCPSSDHHSPQAGTSLGQSGVIEGIYYGYNAAGRTLLVFPLGEPRNCTEIDLPGNFAFISADEQEIFVATKDLEVLRFQRTAVGGMEFVDRCRVDSQICCGVGRFLGTVDGRIYEVLRPQVEAERSIKRSRLGISIKELWRPLTSRFPLVRSLLKSKINSLSLGQGGRLWVSQGGSVWVLDVATGAKLGVADVYGGRVVKVFPVEKFRAASPAGAVVGTPASGVTAGEAAGGAVIVLSTGTRKFLLLETTPVGTRLVVAATRFAEPKAAERQLEVLDAALANDTTVVLLSKFLDKRSGQSVAELGLVVVAAEVARSRREDGVVGGGGDEFREVWEWRADLFDGAAPSDGWARAWLVSTQGAEPRSNVTADFKHPEKLTHAVVAVDQEGGMWRAKLTVRTTTKIVRKFLSERNLHSLRQTAKRLGPEVVASELFELIGNFSDVFSLAPKNADREISIAAGKILFSPDLAKALELIDPLSTVETGSFPEAEVAGFGYVDPHAAGFSLKAMSPRLWGFLRIAGAALSSVWTHPVLRRDAIGNFWSCQDLPVLQNALGSLTAMELFAQKEVSRFCVGVSPAEEELLRKFLFQAALLVQWLSVVVTLEYLPADAAVTTSPSSALAVSGGKGKDLVSPAAWSLRDLLNNSDAVAKEVWVSGNLPEISAPRVFHEKLLAEVSVEKMLAEEKISGRQIFQCEKLIVAYLMDSPKFPQYSKTLADRGSLRGVLEILIRKCRTSESAAVENANLAISVLLERLRARCLNAQLPQFLSQPSLSLPGSRRSLGTPTSSALALPSESSRSSLPLALHQGSGQLALASPGVLAVPDLTNTAVATALGLSNVPLLDDATEEPWKLLYEILRALISSVSVDAFHVALTKWLMIGNLGKPELLRPLIAAAPKFITAYLRKKFPVTLVEVMGDDEARVVEETLSFLGKNLTKENFEKKSSLVKKSFTLYPENSALLEISRKLTIGGELLKIPGVDEVSNFTDWRALFDAARDRNLWQLATDCCLFGNLAKDEVHLTKRLVELALRDCTSKAQVEDVVVKWAREVTPIMNTVVDALAKNLYLAGGTLSVFDVLMGDTQLSRHSIFKAVLMEEVITDVKERNELSLAVAEQWIEELERKKRTEKTEIVLFLADMDDLAARGFQVDNLRMKARHLLSTTSIY